MICIPDIFMKKIACHNHENATKHDLESIASNPAKLVGYQALVEQKLTEIR